MCCGLHVTTGKQGQIHTVVAWDAWPVATRGGLGIWNLGIQNFQRAKFSFWQPKVCILFLKHQYRLRCLQSMHMYRLRRLQSMHTHPYEHIHANPTPMHAFERLGRLDLEIDEITTDASLSIGTSPTTESIARVNPVINLEKCEHPYQI